VPRSSQTRLALASEKPDTCTGPPRLSFPQGAKQEARLSGNDESEEGRPFRRPLYLPPEEAPYTPKQFQALRDAYASAGPAVSFDSHWPRVRDEARKCAKALELQKMLKPHRNVWWRIKRAVRLGTVAELLKTCPQDTDALLYGAMRAGVITPIHERQDYEDELAQLCRLGADERKAALASAMEAGSILWKKTGRPKGGPVEDFATFLGKFYVETTERPLSATQDFDSEFKGPAIRFMRAALAPFYKLPGREKTFPSVLKSPGLRSFILRVGLCGVPSLPVLGNTGLRSLIRRVKARLKSSKP